MVSVDANLCVNLNVKKGKNATCVIPDPIKPEPITTTLDIGASICEHVDRSLLF